MPFLNINIKYIINVLIKNSNRKNYNHKEPEMKRGFIQNLVRKLYAYAIIVFELCAINAKLLLKFAK